MWQKVQKKEQYAHFPIIFVKDRFYCLYSAMKTRSIIFLFLQLICLNNYANNELSPYIFSKIDYQQGLSNSAVLSIFQGNNGLMWFGTYDGVNCYDSKSMEVYRSDFSLNRTLNNNIISSIRQADHDNIWISTHFGVSRLSVITRQVIANYEFPGDYCLYSNAKGNTWVIGNGWIKYYAVNQGKFIEIYRPNYRINNLERRAYVAEDGSLWVFPAGTGGAYRYRLSSFTQKQSEGNPGLSVSYIAFHPCAINYMFYQNGTICFIDSNNELYLYDVARKSKIYIRNIGYLISRYGEITGITPFYDDFIIAFRTNGLFRLNASEKYKESIIDRNIRIFNIYRDVHQDVLWIGSDGKGAIAYYKKHSIATNIMLKDLSPNLSRQVRSIITDRFGNLWFGTKGDGLVCIKEYRKGISPNNTEVYSADIKQNAPSYTKLDNEFQVYSLRESRYHNGIWIGSGANGLFFFSYGDRKIHHINAHLKEIHRIFEANDSVLYLATSGMGLCKIVIKEQNKTILVKAQKQHRFFYDQNEIIMFYAMVTEGDSVLWMGSREKGLIRFDMRTNEYKVISLKEILHKAVDDILSLHFSAGQNKLYVGTTSGLVILSFKNSKTTYQYIGREQGLLNDMIHGILEDNKGFLWLSTNRGLIKYNPKNGFSHAYYYSGGVQVGEFSDDAYYKCPYTNSLFLGGIDGLLHINKNVINDTEFYPEILLRKIIIGRRSVNPGEYYNKEKTALYFKGNELAFSLNFIAPDYINGNDIEYSFMLEGYDKQWSSFSSLNEASYTDVPIGNYVFKVRYKKDVFNNEYKYFEIPVHILPLWYQTIWAKIIYTVLFLLSMGYITFLTKKYISRERMVKNLLEIERNNAVKPYHSRQYREYNNCMSVIYTACEKLREKDISQDECQRSADVIREAMMSSLFGSGYVSSIKPDQISDYIPVNFSITGIVNIKEASNKIIDMLKQQNNDVSLIHADISDELSFNVYRNAFYSILYYSYWLATRNEEYTNINCKESEGKFTLTFSTTNATFLRKMLEVMQGNATPNAKKGTLVDKDFQFQILHSFIISALNQWKCLLEYQDNQSESILSITFTPVLEVEQSANNPTVLILEDRDELIWVISELLSESFTIRSVKNVQQAFELLKGAPVAFSGFIVDMFMYAEAEDKFMEYMNTNRSLFANITFIPMLSWNIKPSTQKDLILWADGYVMMPYDLPFLKEIIFKSIYGQNISRQIGITNIGDFTDKTSCRTAEQADFMKKVLKIINENIDKEDIGSSFIADQMAMSSRQFYRRFKEISSISPSEIIISARMEKAAQLLTETDISIQEVISEVGIISRSYFYKEFANKYGMTPKDYRKIKKSNS